MAKYNYFNIERPEEKICSLWRIRDGKLYIQLLGHWPHYICLFDKVLSVETHAMWTGAEFFVSEVPDEEKKRLNISEDEQYVLFSVKNKENVKIIAREAKIVRELHRKSSTPGNSSTT